MPQVYRDDRSYYLEQHLRQLTRLRHNCHTIFLVVNECPEKNEAFEAKLREAPSRLEGRKMEVIRRPNVGMSYGALADVFERYGDEFDYLLFIEDDYIPVIDDFDKELLSFFGERTGWVCGRYAGCVGYERAHASTANGLVSAEALRAVKRKFGCLPHSSGDDYDDNEMKGQVGLSWSILDSGYEIKDVLSRYSSPFLNSENELVIYGNRDKDCLIRPSGVIMGEVSSCLRDTNIFEFDENTYLKSNPDVQEAVALGKIGSGWEHYVLYGCRESNHRGVPTELRGLVARVVDVLLQASVGK
jgi:hypothetical protein